MSESSGIEWLRDTEGRDGSTWNPVAAFDIETGKRGWFCIHVDGGCPGCYAGATNVFRGTGYDYIAQNLDKHRFEIIRDSSSQSDIDWPLRTPRARRIFPCSMTDIFASWHPDKWIDEMFAVMILARHQTFIITTKQQERMVAYLMHPEREALWMNAVAEKLVSMRSSGCRYYADTSILNQREEWIPLPNVLIGVSINDQTSANMRRDYLRTIANDGWATWVSYEPATGVVDWDGWDFITWLVSGGESGAHARPSHPDCHRNARDFSRANGIEYHFKQWGAWIGSDQVMADGSDPVLSNCKVQHRWPEPKPPGPPYFGMNYSLRVGKKASGRLLDRVEHNGFPQMNVATLDGVQ